MPAKRNHDLPDVSGKGLRWWQCPGAAPPGSNRYEATLARRLHLKLTGVVE